jgi:tryptophan 7-halogenase
LLATVEGETLDTPRLIKFNTGRRQRSWVGNVVGLGLSSGFLEPLESTSIHFVQSSLERLVDLFPTRSMDPALRETYNRQTAAEWVGVRDFIVAHYHLSERDDSEFWRHVRHMPIPDSLAHTIELWRARGVLDVDGGHLFQLGSWSSMLIGQRVLPGGVHALADRADPAYAAQQIRQIADECTAAARRLPDHAAFVSGYCPSV